MSRSRRYRSSGIDWLELLTAVLGGLFFLLSAYCVVSTVTLVASWGEREAFPGSEGFLQGLRGFGLVFFPVAAFVTFGAGWWLAGDQIKLLIRRFRRSDDD